jgi:hypothetical protein
MYQLIITSHSNPNLSGVAKFNQILSELMSIPNVSLGDAVKRLKHGIHILLSIKLSGISDLETQQVRELIDKATTDSLNIDIFFHTFEGSIIEYDLLNIGERIYCANLEIRHSLEGFGKNLVDAWCPCLVDLNRKVQERHLNIFSFGMAHKIHLGYYRLLHQKLSDYKVDYSVWMSTAFHEKANFGDFHSISNQMSQLYGARIQFLGFLSDDAINHFLMKAQLFVAFFPKGIRSNNTSVYAPMEKGLPLITNMDDYSPSWLHHGVNVLDINTMNNDDLGSTRMQTIGEQARRDVNKFVSWESLLNIFN